MEVSHKVVIAIQIFNKINNFINFRKVEIAITMPIPTPPTLDPPKMTIVLKICHVLNAKTPPSPTVTFRVKWLDPSLPPILTRIF